MSGMWPQPQVAEDLLDDVGLINTRNDAHRAPTPDAQQRIGRIHFLDQLGPPLFEERRSRRWGNLDSPCGRWVLSSRFGLVRTGADLDRVSPLPSHRPGRQGPREPAARVSQPPHQTHVRPRRGEGSLSSSRHLPGGDAARPSFPVFVVAALSGPRPERR